MPASIAGALRRAEATSAPFSEPAAMTEAASLCSSFSPARLLGRARRGAPLVFEDHHRWRAHFAVLLARPPAEAEGAAHQLPVPPDGEVLSDLVMSPTQRVLHLLVALLYPTSKGVEPANLRHVRGGELAVCTTPFGLRSRQVGEQVEGGELRQRGGIGGGNHQPPPVASGVERPAGGFQRPPPFSVPIAEGMLHSHPLARLLLPIPGILPHHLLKCLPSASGGEVPTVRRLHGQHIGYPCALQSPSELAMLSVEDVPNNRPEWELHLYGPLDQLKGYVGLGAKGGIRLAALEVVGRGVGGSTSNG